MVLVLTAASIASFSVGVLFGVRQGTEISQISGGLLRAEQARHGLADLNSGDVKQVKGLEEVQLALGLSDHYNFMHYPYKFLIPKSENYIFIAKHDGKTLDKIFMSRIVRYVKENPEAVNTSVYFDPQKLPETTDEQRAWKQDTIQGSKDFEDRVSWVLNQYK